MTERHSMNVTEFIREPYWRIANETVAYLTGIDMCGEMIFGEWKCVRF